MKKKLSLGFLLFFSALFLTGCGHTKSTENEMREDEVMIKEGTMPKTDSMNESEIKEASAVNYTDISVSRAKKMIDENPDLVIIDVSPKYAEGHLPRAVNYYVGDGSLDAVIPNLDKNAMYLVYCHVDSASILGAQKLIDAGFENVYRMEGNYAAWVSAGYPIEK